MRILICGPGLIGKRHIDLCLANSKIKDVIVLGTGSKPGKLFCAERNIRYYSSILKLLQHEQWFDGIIIASPNETHYDLVSNLVSLSQSFLVEKPLCSNSETFQKFIDLEESSKVKILVGHHRLHNKILAKSKEIITNGTLGRLVGFTGSATFRKPETYFEAGRWRQEVGGGPININLSHEIATIDFLLGEIDSMQGITSNARRGFPVEDTVALTFKTKDSVLGSFILSDATVSPYSWEHTSNENEQYPNVKENCYIVFGERGSLSIPQLRVYSQSGEQNWWLDFEITDHEIENYQDTYENQLCHFIEVIKGRTKPLITTRDALRYFNAMKGLTNDL